MTRPSFDEVAFNIAKTIAQRSTCPRLHTGAVIATLDNRVLCTGYNGSLPSTPHCDSNSVPCPACSNGRQYITVISSSGEARGVRGVRCETCHGTQEVPNCLMIDGHCKRTVHAEANAITQAARYGIPIGGCKMYTLHEPCLDCTQLIIRSGISKVYIAQQYRSEEVAKYLAQLGVNGSMFELVTIQV